VSLPAQDPPVSSEAPPEGPLLDQRQDGDRRKRQRRTRNVPVEAERRTGADRRQGPRRQRNINQYDLSADELEFINAVNRFKDKTGKRFPSAKDLLLILRGLGYEKRR
jgi:hypothetical protein